MSTVGEYTPSQVALRFFIAATLSFSTAGLVAMLLITLHRGQRIDSGLTLPPAFVASSMLLFGASLALARSLSSVRLERQRPFRRNLLTALALGALFVGVQTYGLACLLENQRIHTPASSTSEHAFAFVFTAMHALHVTVALLFLSFVTVRALGNRYDHEYYWGARFCTWFWHVLGMAWLGILAVFAIAA
jgi:cytochrome c oxidase subunit III